jgi:FemAB-related protein (PEP-CTERM system-associated)
VTEEHRARRAEEIRVEELCPGGEAEWDAYVHAHPDSSHYHRSAWGGVIRRAFGHSTMLRVARRDGAIAGVLPMVRFANPFFGRYLVSMPYLNRGGILASSSEALRALLQDAAEILAATKSRSCELRHSAPVDPSLPRRGDKVSMSLDVSPGSDALWRKIGPKVRNLVRKAEKAHLVARAGDPEQDLAAFYSLFAENMRDLGTPVYTRRFFDELLRAFPDSTRLSIVERDGVAAAAGICVTHGSFTEIHWAASRRDMLEHSPNMLLYWEAIDWAARSGLATFCFGRSTEDSGPYRFKKQWGAVPSRLAWEYLLSPGAHMPKLHPQNPAFHTATRAWKKVPLSLTKILGPQIVRHIP